MIVKNNLTAIVLLITISFGTNAQTNVSGGIYADTTWTLANSPYIVTADVVVFPGVTLTIEPGVIVKFENSQKLEIRQGVLIANGTATDSITFTSNSPSPTPGIYAGVFLNGGLTPQLNYCNFYYAVDGLSGGSNFTGFTMKHCKIKYNINGVSVYGILDSSDVSYNNGLGVDGFYTVSNCNVSNNQAGIRSVENIINCVIDSNAGIGIDLNSGTILNCFIRHNQIGIEEPYSGGADNCVITNNTTGIVFQASYSITHCIIDSNTTGITFYLIGGSGNNHIANCRIEYNTTGIHDYYHFTGGMNTFTENIIDNNSIGIELANPDTFSCNSICNNTSYGLKFLMSVNSSCMANNYWCTTDSASTEALIYDGYDNVSYGLVNFMPIDTTLCFLISGIAMHEPGDISFSIYPNPASDYLTLETPLNSSKTEIKIFNVIGELEYSGTLEKQTKEIDVSAFESGIYFLEATSGNKIIRQKFIIEKNIR